VTGRCWLADEPVGVHAEHLVGEGEAEAEVLDQPQSPGALGDGMGEAAGSAGPIR
jgi:hypothetical protein